MRRLFLAAVLVAVLIGACGEDNVVLPPPPPPSNEIVSVPVIPQGTSAVLDGDTVTYASGGAASNLAHPIEYRFDLDQAGLGSLTPWGDADTVTVVWIGVGLRDVAAQARCKIHPQVQSQWSPALRVALGLIAGTQITTIMNTYMIGGQPQQEAIDFTDGIPDTVPYGSWITVTYEGSGYSPLLCPDPVNWCFDYQLRYERDSRFFPPGAKFFASPWLPFDPADDNPFSTVNSTSMNIGSVEYVVHVRTTNISGPDPSPPSFAIVGNFDPTLDSYWLENHDGTRINDTETIVWDWWSPVDSDFVVIGAELFRRKTFRFLIKATGHDHPKEDGSGVAGWFYTFPRQSDPGFLEPFGRAGTWVGGVSISTLCDTFTYEAVYPLADVQGDSIFIDNPPPWNDRTHLYNITGRDLPALENFEQFVTFLGQDNLINSYSATDMARRTATGTMSFHIRLQR
ncbi:MAG: hypothetical protein V3V49_00820 [Candidatus Krumholzibacteria bacterium]